MCPPLVGDAEVIVFVLHVRLQTHTAQKVLCETSDASVQWTTVDLDMPMRPIVAGHGQHHSSAVSVCGVASHVASVGKRRWDCACISICLVWLGDVLPAAFVSSCVEVVNFMR